MRRTRLGARHGGRGWCRASARPIGFRHHVSVNSDFYCDEVSSGKTPAAVVRETDTGLASPHTRPFWPVPFAVIPKRHVPSLTDLGDAPEGPLGELLAVQGRAPEVEVEHGAARVLTNLGNSKDSKHRHFHVHSGEAGVTP